LPGAIARAAAQLSSQTSTFFPSGPTGRSGALHAGPRRPHRTDRPGVVRRPRHPVTRGQCRRRRSA